MLCACVRFLNVTSNSWSNSGACLHRVLIRNFKLSFQEGNEHYALINVLRHISSDATSGKTHKHIHTCRERENIEYVNVKKGRHVWLPNYFWLDDGWPLHSRLWGTARPVGHIQWPLSQWELRRSSSKTGNIKKVIYTISHSLTLTSVHTTSPAS